MTNTTRPPDDCGEFADLTARIEEIEYIEAEVETVASAVMENIEPGDSTPGRRALRIEGIDDDGRATLAVDTIPRIAGETTEGAERGSTDTAPPVYVAPRQFVSGYGHDDDQGRVTFPTTREQAHGYVSAQYPELEPGSDQFEARVDDYYQEQLENWQKGATWLARAVTFKLRPPGGPDGDIPAPFTHTVPVDYQR